MSATPAFRALIRCPTPKLALCAELTHLEREPIDFNRILAQHRAYADALKRLGASLTELPALDAFADSVFVEDGALLLDEIVVLTRPGVVSREAEPDALLEPLRGWRPRLARIAAPGTLDGGDVLRVDRTLYVGRSTRSNDEGCRQLRAIAEPLGYRVQVLPLGPSLHLKTAVTALDDQTLLWNPSWLPGDAFAEFERIAIDPREPFAANVLRLPTGWMINAAFPRTAERVMQQAELRGIATSLVDISEFGKAEAGLTCLSLIARN